MKIKIVLLLLLIKSVGGYSQTKPLLSYDELRKICSNYAKRLDSLSAGNPAEYSRMTSVTLFKENGLVKVLLRSDYNVATPFHKGDVHIVTLQSERPWFRFLSEKDLNLHCLENLNLP